MELAVDLIGDFFGVSLAGDLCAMVEIYVKIVVLGVVVVLLLNWKSVEWTSCLCSRHHDDRDLDYLPQQLRSLANFSFFDFSSTRFHFYNWDS